MTVVRPVDAHGLENSCERVDFAQEVLRGESALPQLFGQGVRGGGDRDPAFDQLREQPRDQGGVAGIVEFELVDAHHHVVGQQIDALDEAKDTGELRQLTERRERRRLAEQLLPTRPPRHRVVAEPQAGLEQ